MCFSLNKFIIINIYCFIFHKSKFEVAGLTNFVQETSIDWIDFTVEL